MGDPVAPSRRLAILLASFAWIFPHLALAAGRGEPGRVFAVRVELRDRLSDLKVLHDLDMDVDGVFGTWARVHVLEEELEKLRNLGFTASELPEDVAPVDAAVPSQYHTYETLTSELQQIAADHPSLVRLYSTGKSVQGRELWIVKVSDNPDVEEDEPEVRYIAAMHGDEVVGKEMCVNLLHRLTDTYATDARIEALVDATEIWILPSMNPDGTAAARRYNANNYDLNRNFPDQYDDPVDSTAGRQPETQHVMDWTSTHAPVLSANFHGGAVVANYPYDSTPTGISTYALSPDDSAFVSTSRTYADSNPSMYASNSDPSFDRGICNGSDWYAISGGMQDWEYVWRGGREVTLEISSVKWPSASELPNFWAQNQESMLRYFERVHAGVRGIVTDAATGSPLAATVRVAGNPIASFTDPAVGDYHRLVLPGRYDLEIGATGYATAQVRDVVVRDGAPATRIDVALVPLAAEIQPQTGRVLDGAGGNGALDAGETTDLAITARNFGSLATSIGAVLEPTTWYARATRPEASYPDLAAGASGESLAPHHEVSVDPGAPTGHKAGFALRWSSAEGYGESEPFFLPVGAAACTTIASSDVPKTIADRTTVSSGLAFPTDLEISDVNVRVDIGHTYVGDLHVKVVSPAGTPVTLHARSGGSTDDIVAWYDTDRAPAEPLARLNGEHAQGTWTLQVNDGTPFNTGTLRGWSLEACGRPFEATTPEMKLRDVAKGSGDATVLTWWRYPGLTSYRVYRSTSLQPRGAFTDVTAADDDATDATFSDATAAPVVYWLVTGVGPAGEGAR